MRFPSRTLLGAALLLTVSGAGCLPGSVPLELPAMTASALAERYAGTRAASGGERQLLAYDRAGDGRAIEVVGDLAAARTVVVFVPGTGFSLDDFDGTSVSPAGAARAIHARAAALSPGEPVAVIGWLGYDAPEMTDWQVITTLPAAKGAMALRKLATALRGKERVSLVCHSYGSVVCGQAAPGLPVDDIVVLGSPGMGAATRAELRTPAQVWAALGAKDDVLRPGVRLGPIGYGADPVTPAFGARVFDGGPGGHNDYLRAGNPALDRIVSIALTGEASCNRGSCQEGARPKALG
ncbi:MULTISPECIES: alpha/beta hydrolase [Nonomuraea]|uniref:Alpha/beta hydrolase family protein n=1 Tax=Nonomuraea recticatena TaxID=46178 RepID=A0ABN3RDU2_9ACTN